MFMLIWHNPSLWIHCSCPVTVQTGSVTVQPTICQWPMSYTVKPRISNHPVHLANGDIIFWYKVVNYVTDVPNKITSLICTLCSVPEVTWLLRFHCRCYANVSHKFHHGSTWPGHHVLAIPQVGNNPCTEYGFVVNFVYRIIEAKMLNYGSKILILSEKFGRRLIFRLCENEIDRVIIF